MLLELEAVSRQFRVGDAVVDALSDVTLSVDEGQYVAIVGPSGSGKSTLLQLIGLLDRPTSGSLQLLGEDVSALDDGERTKIRLHTLGFVFQRFHILHDLTALENVALPMEAAGVPLDERYERAADLLATMGMADRLHFRPSQLSGGQRQRVAVARALANRPRLVLADEPTGELHSEDRARVIELFRQITREGRTIIVVTHDLAVAEHAERRIVIRDGRIQEAA
jgi:putative ABC transport system ATP-binding protein